MEKNFKEFVESRKHEPSFLYMLLDRMRMDCDYFLGFGNGRVNFLEGSDVNKHIDYMLTIYNALLEKPEWLTKEQIEEYRNRMLNYNKQ